MGTRIAMLAMFLQLSFWQAQTATVKFCYYKESCGPPSWPHKYPTCNGSSQSPIDIKTDRAIRNSDLGPFTFKNYDNPKLVLKIQHSAMTVKATINSSMELTAGGLHGDYVAAQFHLHWGRNAMSLGSEHALDGQRTGMELHIVHRRKDLNLTEVFRVSGGLAVLGFLIEIEEGIPEDAAWKNLTKTFQYLQEDGDHIYLNGTVSLMDLIKSVNLTKYYRYNGSLTTPECNQVVTWTVFEEPIRLSASLLESLFRDMYVNKSEGVQLADNFRTLQRNGNPVWASQDASRAAAPSTAPPTTAAAPSTAPPTTARNSVDARRGSQSLALLPLLAGLFFRPL